MTIEMDRALGAIVTLLIGCLLLPIVAGYAVQLIPALVALLVLLGVVRLALPPPRSRRRS